MDEGTTLAVWRLVSSCSILETLDDCLYVGVSAATIFVFEASTHSLSRTIVAYDQCERCVELYGLAAPIVEGTDSCGTRLANIQVYSHVSCHAYPRIESLSILAEEVCQ